MNVIDLICKEEGYRKKAYYCSEGYPTIGIGWRIGDKDQPLEHFKHLSISEDIAKAKLKESVYKIMIIMYEKSNNLSSLSNPRMAVIISMAYQLGISGLYKFKKMLAAIEIEDWDLAAKEGLDSKWAKQTPERASRHMDMMLTGEWHSLYK